MIKNNTYTQRINESYGEAVAELGNRYSVASGDGHLHGGIIPFIKKHPVRAAAIGTTSALAIAASVYALGPVITIAQAAGIAGFVLARESATFKEHRHILAVASASCLLSATQQAMMAATGDAGSYIPGGIMLGHAALTLSAFAVIPETRKAFRAAVTWGGGIVGAAAAAYASYKYENGTGIIPAVTTLGNSLLFSIKDGSTPRARLGYIGMNIGHVFLWATQPVQSAALLATELMYLTTHSVTLAENDVPVADRDTGKVFTKRERLSAYFKDVIGKGKKPEDIGVVRKEQGWERPDNKVYARGWRLLLGS